jgi:hypothetical protein
MRIKLLIVPVLLGTIFLSSCKQNSITLDATNAKGEVPLLGNLYFRFSSSLATDSMLNAWDSTEYISFEPAIPGKFRWEQPDQLVFSPSQPLAPATSYKAKVRNAVLRFSKFNKVKGDEKLSFHTPPLSLDNSRVIWVLSDEGGQAAVPQVDLYFNYRINPSDIKDKLKIEISGKEVEFNVITVSPDNKISARVRGLKQEDKEQEAKITIAKGLRPDIGRNNTEEDIVFSLGVPSPYVLSIQNLESEHDGTEGVVRISTSQQLTNENIKGNIVFEPSVEY